MKNYDLHLHPEPFELIKSGKKTVEYRLNDEKRKQFKIGDTLTFYKRPEEVETIITRIVDLKYYDTLYEMYAATFDELKDRYDSVEAAVLDTPYYTDEEVKKYGCVAIHIQKI